ncbi:MAG: GGDEF domain-containing protein [Burkholderiales bacterium PBB4]|nr:MAG: GGDEF domain-containing protein [Burkholderiales bacterium PBB4]
MPNLLIVNAAVSLTMGVALVYVWHKDRTHEFTRDIGLANMAHMLVPLTYAFLNHSGETVRMWGGLILATVAGTYTTLLIVGAAQLADRKLSRQVAFAVLLGVVAINVQALQLGGIQMGQLAVATINTMVGLLCAYWLWKPGAAQSISEKWVGPLLVALGLIQYIFAFAGDAGTGLQTTLGILLRITLGLVLINAALERSNLHANKQRHRFERLAERSLEGIMISQGNRCVVYANPACLAIYGVSSIAELNVATVARTIPRAERTAVARIIEQIENGEISDAKYEAQRRRSDGTPIWLRFHYFQTEWDHAPAVQVLITDDSERIKASQALIQQALRDELTGLPNRAALINSLRARCKTDGDPVSFVLILMNLDRFKLFNEAHGPTTGDNVLKTVGDSLRKVMQADCEVMRLAGDEFAIVSPAHAKGEVAVSMVAAIKDLLSRPLLVAGDEIFVDASLGIALYPNSARDAESLLRAANAAMHVAKRTPGTSYRLAEKAFERGSSNALEQEQALRAAVDSADIYLTYQPKVDARTGRLTSFEALARWNRPDFGEVSPVDFIAAAERTGLIGALGKSLLRRACQQISTWRKRHPYCVPVAVNVSPLQLLDPRFPQVIAEMLSEHALEPGWLTLEITESSAVQNLAQTVAQVEQLRQMGVQVAMDDFGTGFSSLNMLRSLRLHSVKIDRGLIDPLPSPDAVAVVRAICQLADALHLHVVAEGVETTEQAEAARLAGCGELQGYLYAKPLRSEHAEQWLLAMADTRSTAIEATVLSPL